MKFFIFLFFVICFAYFIFGKEEEDILLFNFTQNADLNSRTNFLKRLWICYAKKVENIGWTYTITIKDDNKEPTKNIIFISNNQKYATLTVNEDNKEPIQTIIFIQNDEEYPQSSIESLNGNIKYLQAYFNTKFFC